MNPRNRNGKSAGLLALSLTSLVALSMSQSWAREAAHTAPPPKKIVQPTAQVAAPPKPVLAVTTPVSSAESVLNARIRQIGEAFNGDIGIAVKDIQTGYTAAYDGNTYFP